MINNELDSEYFKWMCQLVCNNDISNISNYSKLFKHLHDVDFIYKIPMDGNRYEDGINLRYRFGYEKTYDYPYIAAEIDNKSCSIFEMMVALSLRCEEDIMVDLNGKTDASRWFWVMIKNLGLGESNNFNYDQRHVDRVLSNFLERRYSKDGKGGLFWIKNTSKDLRNVEIWYQMCWYLNDEMEKTK